MPKRFPSIAFSFGLILLLAGCATETAIPEDQLYRAPRTGEVAYLKGATLVESGVFAARHYGFVLMIDQKFVHHAEDNWQTPIAVSPGRHEIAVEYRQSIFKARTLFKLDARPGATYEVKITPGSKEDSDVRYCDFSLVDTATGKPVLPVSRAHVSGSLNRSNFRPLD